MRPAGVRFNNPQTLMRIAILAILLGAGQWAYDRYGGEACGNVYRVGDLITLMSDNS